VYKEVASAVPEPPLRGFTFTIASDAMKPVSDAKVAMMTVDRAHSPLFFFDSHQRMTN
jgi:hypothetical protein